MDRIYGNEYLKENYEVTQKLVIEGSTKVKKLARALNTLEAHRMSKKNALSTIDVM